MQFQIPSRGLQFYSPPWLCKCSMSYCPHPADRQAPRLGNFIFNRDGGGAILYLTSFNNLYKPPLPSSHRMCRLTHPRSLVRGVIFPARLLKIEIIIKKIFPQFQNCPPPYIRGNRTWMTDCILLGFVQHKRTEKWSWQRALEMASQQPC